MAYSEKVVDHFNNPRNMGSFTGEDLCANRMTQSIPLSIRLGIMEGNTAMPRMAFRCILAVLVTGAIGGCSVMKGGSSTILPSSAFFRSDGSELTRLHAVAVSQDTQMKTCHTGAACETAYYVRGLIALFENRADAISVFQQLHTAMPTSRYDVAALGWLHLLQDPTLSSVSSQALRVQLRQEVLHTLLGHFDLTLARSGNDGAVRIAELNP